MKKFIVKWLINQDNLNMVEVIEVIGNSLDIEEIYEFDVTYVGDLITLTLGEVNAETAKEAAFCFEHLLLEETIATNFSVYDRYGRLIVECDVRPEQEF